MRSGYSTTIPRRKNITLSPVNRCHRPQHQHHGRTFMIRRSCSGGTKRFCLLWAAETWRFRYERSISATIDSFEPCIARKTKYEQRHDKVILLYDARPHVAKVIKKYLETHKWDVLPHTRRITPSDYFWLFRRMQQVTGSLLSQKSKIAGFKIGSPPKTSHFFEMEFKNCLRDGKK